MPRNHRLEDHSRFLVNFSSVYAEVHLPGELLQGKDGADSKVTIERFLPEVEVVHKHSAASRRLLVRGRNGRVYSYLVQHAPSKPARTEERFVQLLRLLNVFQARRKETRKRNLQYVMREAERTGLPAPLLVHINESREGARV